jgi:hypothetical protein
MTTANGQPSEQPHPRHLTGLQAPDEIHAQAAAAGGGQYTGSGEPAPKVIGGNPQDGTPVEHDESGLHVTGVQPEQTT